jgi:tetratricopeptide (TPR) repeat protein
MAYIWMATAGDAKNHLGSWEQAVAWFRRAIEVNRNNPVYLNLAAALAQLGRLDEARSAVKAGLALNPAYAVSRRRARLQSSMASARGSTRSRTSCSRCAARIVRS